MTKKHHFILKIAQIVLSIYALNVSAQFNLYIPPNFDRAYTQHSRSRDGAPGEKYWQNKPSYRMQLNFDPSTYTLDGHLEVRYSNHSPDTLKEIVWSLLGDIYGRKSLHDFPLDVNQLGEGMHILEMKVAGRPVDLNKSFKRSGTNGTLALDAPLLPGGVLSMEVSWNFTYPAHITIRNGHYGDSTFLVGHCYPKIAVYDDIDGWDRSDYRGYAEFYGEYADYAVSVTVPPMFKVWATGRFINAEEVLLSKYYRRLERARTSGEVVHVITKEEAEKRVTKPGEAITWKFEAMQVPDFAFGTSPRFCWDARKVMVDTQNSRSVLVQTAYPPERIYYPRLIYMLDTLMRHYSSEIPGIPFPFPMMTIFNGNDGMEYPMMCNNAEGNSWSSSVGLAYHEVAHSYFPFYVGTNERKYAWMDEGWASFFPQFYWGLHVPEFDYFKSRMERYYKMAGDYDEVPLMTSTRLLHDRPPYRQASYNKPFFAYVYLQHLLGEKVFVGALRGYMRDWAGKHPTPYDFFYSMERYSGQNLSWYWHGWFFEQGYADLGIEQGEGATLIVKNIGGLPLPIRIVALMASGAKKTITLSLDAWKDGSTSLEIPLPAKDRIKEVRLGDEWIIDVNPSNNVLVFPVKN